MFLLYMFIMYVYNVLLCWAKFFFLFFFLPLQSPTDMGRVKGTWDKLEDFVNCDL